MAILKVKNTQGEWQSIPAFKGDKGDPGKDGAIQYSAGEGVKIENNTISAEVTKQYVTDSINEAIQTTLGGSY